MNSFLLCSFFGVFVSVYATAQEIEPDTPNSPVAVQEVKCNGNNTTDCQFIASHLNIKLGDPIDDVEIRHAKLKLLSLPYFEAVDIHLDKGSEKGKVILTVEVVESSPFTKEFALGTAVRGSYLSQNISGRISHQNFFGTGKILDVSIGARMPLSDPKQKAFATRLQYIDPNLYGSTRFFLIGGLSYRDSFESGQNEDFYSTKQLDIDLTLGMRFGEFSYLTAGYQYLPVSKVSYQHTFYDEVHSSNHDDYYRRFYLLSYGWNSEDDPYFPTQGSRFNLSYLFSPDEVNYLLLPGSLSFRKSWRTATDSIWTIKIGGTPGTAYRQPIYEDLGTSVSFSQLFGSSNLLGGIKRGSWYIEPGFVTGFPSKFGLSNNSPGLKVGVRLESKLFGIVDLYAIGTRDSSIGAYP